MSEKINIGVRSKLWKKMLRLVRSSNMVEPETALGLGKFKDMLRPANCSGTLRGPKLYPRRCE